MLLASLAIHVLGPSAVRALGWGPDSWAYQVKVGLKEGSELAGWVLLLPPLARLALEPRTRSAERRAGRGAVCRGCLVTSTSVLTALLLAVGVVVAVPALYLLTVLGRRPLLPCA